MVSLLIPIAAAQKFRIPRIADIFVQASEPRTGNFEVHFTVDFSGETSFNPLRTAWIV